MDEKAQHIIEALVQPCILIGDDGRIRAANRPATEIFGSAIIGRSQSVAIRHPGLTRGIGLARTSAQRSQTRITLAVRGGVEAHFLARAVPLSGTGARSVLVTLEDTGAGAETERMRRDFVANVSHELKTPLTGILGFLETLRGAAIDDPDAARAFLDMMDGEAQRMKRLVDDLLTLSRVEAMERRRPTGRVEMSRLLDETIELQRDQAGKAGQRLQRKGSNDPAWVTGDEDQLRQVIGNLVSNAIDHAGEGVEITGAISQVERDPILRSAAILLEISDTGKGFETHHLPRLTERFYRADDHRTGGGTGLGLSIVKHVVARHRGRLAITAAPGQGAAFKVFLPLANAP